MIFNHTAGRLSVLDEEVVRAVPPGGNWRDLPADFASKRIEQIRASASRGEGSRSTYYGRLRWDRPSYTISTYFNRPGNGCFIHPVAPRLLTVREAARLQTFPDNFRFVGAGRRPFVQVGNAVPPLLAHQLATLYEPGTLVDLFSGAGGMSLGFEWAGFELIAASDNDSAANDALRSSSDRGFDPVVPADLGNPEDHRRVMSAVRQRLSGKRLDVLVGGSPCQGFSTAGFARMSDPRNKLLFSFIAAVEALRPRVVLMENVPALTWRRRRPFLEGILRELQRLGYTCDARILHAEGYGVPQLRRRLFVAAALGETPRWPTPWLKIVEPAQLAHQPGYASADLPSPATVRDAIGDLPEATVTSSETLPYPSEAQTLFQRWARGEVRLTAYAHRAVPAGDLQTALLAS
ncbi:MAG TPA: DNA (cytosine-5-)-methyltransferase [Gaiellaceae bacterium]|nr:DNA (cytosine-5-)-methyltransferase [Gaiellaceae bacterium]